MEDTVGIIDRPGVTRLFARIEGLTPFCLVLQDNLLPEHYEAIANDYYRTNLTAGGGSGHAQELLLIRRITFKNGDLLYDFRRRKTTKQRSEAQLRSAAIAAAEADARGAGPSGGAIGGAGDKLYDPLLTAKIVAESMTRTEAPSNVPACETTTMVVSIAFGRLINLMTDPYAPPFLEEVFWATYRQFATPLTVLSKLIERYNAPPLARPGEPQRTPLEQSLYDDTILALKTRIFRMLETWVSRAYFDFAEDTTWRMLDDFAREKIDLDAAPPSLLQLMRDRDRTALEHRKPQTMPGVVNRRLTSSGLLSQYGPREVANQLTILTQLVHSRIHPHELIGGLWEGAQSHKVPNFVAYRDFFSRVSNWVTYAVVSETDLVRRVANLTAVLALVDELMRLRNYDMAIAVYGGAMEAPCERLSATWGRISDESMRRSEEFKQLFSAEGNWKAIKEVIANSSRPHFPCIAIFMRDLKHLEELPMVEKGLLHYYRCIRQHALITTLLEGGRARVDGLLPNYDVQGAFAFWRIVDDKVLMDMSFGAQAK